MGRPINSTVSCDFSVASGADLEFAPFRLDLRRERLWCDGRPVGLRPKTFAVLRYLAEHPERLIKKEELLSALWGEVAVGDAVLKTTLKEIRRALGDSARQPRFVETAHGRGYRFIGPLKSTPRVAIDEPALPSPPSSATSLVGRELDLGRLRRALERARAGERRVVFVSGEPGIGKSSLLDAFLASLAGDASTCIGRARSIEQHGPGEAYLPILEMLGRISRSERGPELREILQRAAPGCLKLLHGVDERAPGRHGVASGAAPCLLRELVDALEAFTRRRPLILCIEELELADGGTLDLLQHLAQRSDAASLLIVLSHTPLEGPADTRRCIRNLERRSVERGRAEIVRLRPLDEHDVERHLDQRFPGHVFPRALAAFLARRCGGKPAFVARLLDGWVERSWVLPGDGRWSLARSLDELADDVPESIVVSIEAEKERRGAFERRVLDAASVLEPEFTIVQLARALQAEPAQVEQACLRLARAGRFLRWGELGSGARPGQHHCQFVHPLHRQVIGQSVGEARRAQLLVRAQNVPPAALLRSAGAPLAHHPGGPSTRPAGGATGRISGRQARAELPSARGHHRE